MQCEPLVTYAGGATRRSFGAAPFCTFKYSNSLDGGGWHEEALQCFDHVPGRWGCELPGRFPQTGVPVGVIISASRPPRMQKEGPWHAS